ncbi:MAG: DUF1850 domain-containing protein [Casimicrobiaceae bacterium]|nr:DUF1850 domain-containing protein [Casimicrobiaceae bacterium]
MSAHAASAFVATARFTLAWTHTRERMRWEEDYELRVSSDVAAEHGNAEEAPSAVWLERTEARISGSGAGVDPDEGAFRDGPWYRDRRRGPRLEALRLARSAYAADYELCLGTHGAGDPAGCRPLSVWLDASHDRVVLYPCRRSNRPYSAPRRRLTALKRFDRPVPDCARDSSIRKPSRLAWTRSRLHKPPGGQLSSPLHVCTDEAARAALGRAQSARA